MYTPTEDIDRTGTVHRLTRPTPASPEHRASYLEAIRADLAARHPAASEAELDVRHAAAIARARRERPAS